MISLDPKWKKMKLLEQIEEIEVNIQNISVRPRSERKLIEKRRALISENDKWIRIEGFEPGNDRLSEKSTGDV